ncbi:MAG: cell division protein ZapA [Gammaproteobacteria bacterium]|nr:cell division protein ZapA [Gammaproteobacteria bacterium]
MKDNTIPVVVRILDKEYRIACQRGEENDLLTSARYLDGKMRSIRSTGKVIGTDRVAVMAALNIAHELLQQQHQKDSASGTFRTRLQRIQEKIEIALEPSKRLEV